MDVLTRNNVVEHGSRDAQPMLFTHGFGCDQSMWRYVWPAFSKDHRVVLFDLVGFGNSDHSAWDPNRYASLEGYAEDRSRDLPRARPHGRGLRRSLRQLDDRCPRRGSGAEPVRPAGPHRTVTALHRRPGLR